MAQDVVRAVRASHERLRGLLDGLDEEALRAPSYDDEWSIADVASHLGSQAEIFSQWLSAGLDAGDAADVSTQPIWDRWNAKPPAEQAKDSVTASDALLARLEALPEDVRFALSFYGQQLDLTGLATMRLNEQALHTWDIAVALDPAATVLPDAVTLLVDATAPDIAARSGKPVPGAEPVVVATTDPARVFRITLDPDVTLTRVEEGTADVTLPAEAFLRLVAGRLDPAPGESPHLTGLRNSFPGI
jgi:uncharacterized protein (TIGR03083 family)